MVSDQIRWCFLPFAVFILGCSSASDAPEKDGSVEVSSYAGLPGARQTHHDELRAEIARLDSELATPALLAARERNVGVGLPTVRVDAGRELQEIFPVNTAEQLSQVLDSVYPPGEFSFGQRRLSRVGSLLAEHRMQLASLRRLMDRSDLAFDWDPTKGISDELTFVELARTGIRLVSLENAELIEHGRLSESVESLHRLLRFTRALADVQHIVPRIAAVHVRAELLFIALAISGHPEIDRDLYSRLSQLLSVELAAFPSDDRAWIGDRAAGLHLYELLRDGYLLSMLTYDELQSFRDEIGIERLGQLVADNLDGDQMFYLNAMRQTIQSCQRPYYQRRQQQIQLERDLQALRDTATFPFVADYFLLGELAVGQRLQALDRARLEAWQLALQAAIEGHAEAGVNPLTGFPFVLDIRSDRIIVDGIDPEHREAAIEIPIPSHVRTPSADVRAATAGNRIADTH